MVYFSFFYLEVFVYFLLQVVERPFGFFPILNTLRNNTGNYLIDLEVFGARRRQERLLSLGPSCSISVHIRKKTLK